PGYTKQIATEPLPYPGRQAHAGPEPRRAVPAAGSLHTVASATPLQRQTRRAAAEWRLAKRRVRTNSCSSSENTPGFHGRGYPSLRGARTAAPNQTFLNQLRLNLAGDQEGGLRCDIGFGGTDD